MLLRTALKGYFEMLDALTRPPPSIQARVAGYPDDLDKISHHLRLTAINMHDLVNQLRPVQAKENLIKIVKEEIQDKRDRTRQLQRYAVPFYRRLRKRIVLTCDAVQSNKSKKPYKSLSGTTDKAAPAPI